MWQITFIQQPPFQTEDNIQVDLLIISIPITTTGSTDDQFGGK